MTKADESRKNPIPGDADRVFYACRSRSAVRPLGKRDHVSANRGGDTLGHAFRAWPTR
ncbi:hypothetical protein BURMUCF1_A2225 [Burkholderia multivorans ATCC BAA-247]|nr:hypothetical protein BURMUCF1_A2225 [Burkholderia multivorans ATCC BAA-247]